MVTTEGIHPFGHKDTAITSTATVVHELKGGLPGGQTLVTSTAAIRLTLRYHLWRRSVVASTATIRLRVLHCLLRPSAVHTGHIKNTRLHASGICMTHVAREGYCSLVPHPEQNSG